MNIEKEVNLIEIMTIKRWLLDKGEEEYLIGKYLDNYEFENYLSLKYRLACLRDRDRERENT